MKYILVFGALLTCLSFRFSDSRSLMGQKMETLRQDTIYNISISNIDESTVILESFRGRKMLIVVLPLTAEDTNIDITELRAIQNRYGDSLAVIGVPAEELGYTSSLKQQIKDLYGSQSAGFVITKGMKVKKTSGTSQSLLFQWLTDRNKNRYFDRDVRGTGDKFFVDEAGQLYAVLGSQIKLSNPVIAKVLSKPVAH